MNKKFLFFIGLAFFCLTATKIFAVPGYCKLSDRIVSQYSHELEKKKSLYLTGSGGAMMDDIQRISVDYLSFEALEVDAARNLYIGIVEEYLKRINQNKAIFPYLHNYPFEFKNLDVMISFEDHSGKRRGNGLVTLIFQRRNEEIVYESYNHEKGCFYKLHREPYTEALRIARQGPCQ